MSQVMHFSDDNLRAYLDGSKALQPVALELPGARAPGADRWYHSDLVAENLLLRKDRLAAVLDFGGLAIGDPTIELHGAWELFDPPARRTFRAALGVEASTRYTDHSATNELRTP